MSKVTNILLVGVGGQGTILASKILAQVWLPFLKKDGIMIVNTQVIEPMPVIIGAARYPEGIIEKLQAQRERVIAVDALTEAKNAGNAKASNVVLIGVLAKKTGIDHELWQKALEAKVPQKLIEVNRQAFAAGYALG